MAENGSGPGSLGGRAGFQTPKVACSHCDGRGGVGPGPQVVPGLVRVPGVFPLRRPREAAPPALSELRFCGSLPSPAATR